MRGSPGLGTIQPSQADYFQSNRGGGDGDYRTVVLAPSNIQEAVDFTHEAFDIDDQYRNPVLVVCDGLIGQMMEPIVWKDLPTRTLPPKDWAASGKHGRTQPNAINSLYMEPEVCDRHNDHLADKYAEMERNEVRFETLHCDDAEVVIVAYGTPARIAISAIEVLREQGIKAGLFRPITLWPFPEKALSDLSAQPQIKALLTVEMSMGQMLDDVRLSVEGKRPISFLGHAGGVIPTVEEIIESATKAWKEAQ